MYVSETVPWAKGLRGLKRWHHARQKKSHGCSSTPRSSLKRAWRAGLRRALAGDGHAGHGGTEGMPPELPVPVVRHTGAASGPM